MISVNRLSVSAASDESCDKSKMLDLCMHCYLRLEDAVKIGCSN